MLQAVQNVTSFCCKALNILHLDIEINTKRVEWSVNQHYVYCIFGLCKNGHISLWQKQSLCLFFAASRTNNYDIFFIFIYRETKIDIFFVNFLFSFLVFKIQHCWQRTQCKLIYLKSLHTQLTHQHVLNFLKNFLLSPSFSFTFQ